jgi:hypothetical protein
MNRLPHLLYNSTASADSSLLYPQGVAVVHPMPTTKKELAIASGVFVAHLIPFAHSQRCPWVSAAVQCNAALVALGLNEPPVGIPIATRRQILMDYLGTAMRA